MNRTAADADAGTDADIAIIGAGAAGLSLAWRLSQHPDARGRTPEVVLIEPPPGPVRTPARTWCFWEEPGGEWDDLVSASWSRVLVRGRDGAGVCGTAPWPYKMLRSPDFTRALETRLASAPGVRRISGTAGSVTGRGGTGGTGSAYGEDGARGARVLGEDGEGRPFQVSARWVFDSRPLLPAQLPPARTTLLQHFRGWYVRTGAERFDPSVAELMDFRTPQPRTGVSFAYVLPLSTREALVEYTEFSPAPLQREAYDAALRHYTTRIRPLGDFTVTAAEQGVIPMTDGVFPRRLGSCVFPLGAAAGAIRPATGYAFAAIQRQTAAVAGAWRAGRVPVPPRAHARRHRAMDAALLRALATGRVEGAGFFTGLFRDNPLPRVVRFLDGRSTLPEEWALGLRAPVFPMARSLAELPFRARTLPGRRTEPVRPWSTAGPPLDPAATAAPHPVRKDSP